MIKGYIFDYGATLDTAGCHWGQMLRHAYQRQQVPVTEQQFRDAYVYGERTLGNSPIIQPDYTFYKTLQVKIRLEMEQALYIRRMGCRRGDVPKEARCRAGGCLWQGENDHCSQP